MTSVTRVQSTSLHTEDFCELQEALTDWDQEYFQLSPGKFKGSVELVQVGATQIMRECWGRKIRYRGTTPPGAFGFALALEQTETSDWVGYKADRDTVILQAPGREADLVPTDHWDALVLSVPEEEVHTLTRALSGGELSGELHGTITLSKEAAARLRHLGRDFLTRAKSHSSDSVSLVASQAAQFVRAFVWEVIREQERAKFFAEPVKQGAIVRHATDLATTPGSGKLGLADICAQLGISLRTLHYAFQDVTGMSSAAWLRRTRLNHVHTALKKASPRDVKIKDVAQENGFFHYGHFSEQYSRLFGFAPMQTLHAT